MDRLKELILEIHRRSLWQVLVVYLGASWGVLEAVDHVVDRFLLPEWVSGAAIVLLLIGLPIVLATAMVRERPEPASSPTPDLRDPTLLGDTGTVGSEDEGGAAVARLLTWPRAVLGGVLAFTLLGLVSAFIVLRGTTRVAEAKGAAGDAFEERAWIVVAEFESSEGEAEVGDAAQTALIVDLQQSRYVNVFSHNQIEPVLRRMDQPDAVTVDEQLALEVAEREGLAAVLAGEVARLGSDYALSARVVEPSTRRDLIAVRAVARPDRLAEGVERLSREVRRRLGEQADAIEESKPLPQVTTRSLEALQRYAQAVEALHAQDQDRAIRLATEAVELDSTFAMAYRLLGVAYGNTGRIGEGIASTSRAFELRERLTERERLHVEAFHAYQAELDVQRAAETYRHLLARYPDDHRAANNLGVMAGTWLGDYEEAYRAYLRALTADPYNQLSYGNAIIAARYTDRFDAADSLIGVAEARGFRDAAAHWRLEQAIGRARWERADALCDSLLRAVSGPERLVEDRRTCGGLHLARGRIREGLPLIEAVADRLGSSRRFLNYGRLVTEMALAEAMRGQPEAARSRLTGMLARFPGDSIPHPDKTITRQRLRFVAAELESHGTLERIAEVYSLPADTSLWAVRQGERIGEAAVALAEGDPEEALARLRQARSFDAAPDDWRAMIDHLSGQAFDRLGQTGSAIAHFQRTIDPARVADSDFWLVHMPITKRRLAELEESRGDMDAALEHYRDLLELWSEADPEMAGQVSAVRRAVSRLSGAETG